jgi:hypothetical protein
MVILLCVVCDLISASITGRQPSGCFDLLRKLHDVIHGYHLAIAGDAVLNLLKGWCQ